MKKASLEPGEEFINQQYLEVILQQCDSAVDAIRKLEALLRANPLENRKIFDSLHHFLTHASMVSKMLWPVKSAQQRGERLRKLLNIPDNHILEDRDLRNFIEHIDERIDLWARQSVGLIMVDLYIGPRSSLGGQLADARNILRLYDHQAKTYIVFGEEYRIQDILTGLTGIAETLMGMGYQPTLGP